MVLDIPRDSDGPEFDWLARRLKGKGGLLIAKASDNSISDTHMYEV